MIFLWCLFLLITSVTHFCGIFSRKKTPANCRSQCMLDFKENKPLTQKNTPKRAKKCKIVVQILFDFLAKILPQRFGQKKSNTMLEKWHKKEGHTGYQHRNPLSAKYWTACTPGMYSEIHCNIPKDFYGPNICQGFHLLVYI